VVASMARAGMRPLASNLGLNTRFSSSDFLSSQDPNDIGEDGVAMRGVYHFSSFCRV